MYKVEPGDSHAISRISLHILGLFIPLRIPIQPCVVKDIPVQNHPAKSSNFAMFISPVWVVAFVLQPLLSTAVPVPEPAPSPPGIPSSSTAKSELAGLTVAAQGSQDGYDRDKFPHWITKNG
jgi:hypothetical protein